MYINSGYLKNAKIDFRDISRPLTVGSCGTYRLTGQLNDIPVHWPKGRLDYQLLYVAAGRARFFFGREETVVEAGSMVLYSPLEEQRYIFRTADRPEVFWVHFSGSDVKDILHCYRMTNRQHVYCTGTRSEFRWIFQRMMLELQLCKPMYEEMVSSLLNDLLLLICRQLERRPDTVQDMMVEAIAYFSEHYNRDINISDYARAHHISTNHFIRSLKQYIGMTPKQYIASIRMTNARVLLENSSYSIAQIAAFVGYGDPLYFGRLFKRETGMTPSQYRRQFLRAGTEGRAKETADSGS